MTCQPSLTGKTDLITLICLEPLRHLSALLHSSESRIDVMHVHKHEQHSSTKFASYSKLGCLEADQSIVPDLPSVPSGLILFGL